MKKLWIIALFILVAGCTANSGNQNQNNKSLATPAKKDAIVYTCPMDTDILSDKPGVCPRCGMDLVEKDTSKMEE